MQPALVVVVAVVLGVWLVAALDAVGVVLLGAPLVVLFPIHRVAIGAGVGLALAALPVFGLLWLAGRWPAKRLGWAPSTVGAALLGVGLAAALIPVHDAFAVHPLGTVLTTVYAAFPAALAFLGIDRVRRRAQTPWIAGAVLLAGVLAVHVVNARYFTGLYPLLHKGLSLVALVGAVAAAALLVGRLPVRRLGVGLGALGLSALLSWPVSDVARTRAIAFAHGTELAHLFDLAEAASDRDGDGVGASLGGADCDDEDPDVHALRFEVPGNGVDDNCRLGDAPADQKWAPARVAPRPAALDAWRTAHGRPDVVLVFVDTLRWDFVDGSRTPNIAALADSGVRFTQARGTAPRTPHAWMAMLRGRFVGRILGCRRDILNPGRATVLHGLQGAGYKTWGRFVGKSWKRFHLASGYTRLLQRDHTAGKSGSRVTRDVLNLAKDHRKSHADAPMMVVAHYVDPHAPYLPHPDFPAKSDSLRDTYAAEIQATDHQVGLLLKGLRAAGRPTLVVVFADHGENLGDHGGKGGHHGVSVYDEVVRVPLVVAGPGVVPGTVDDPVSLVDVAPTLVELLDLKPLPRPDGRSLAGYLLGEPPEPTWTVSEFYDFGHRLRAIVDGDLKLVVDVRRNLRQLFDVRANPGEQVDLALARPEDADRLQRTLETWVERQADPEQRNPEDCTGLVGRGDSARRKKKKRGG